MRFYSTIVLVICSFFAVSVVCAQSVINDTTTCVFQTANTQELTGPRLGVDMYGSGITAKAWFSTEYAGIGTYLNIGDGAYELPVLQNKGGAGAGWQYSQEITEHNGNAFIINQASGNTATLGVGGPNTQWGYGATLYRSGNSIIQSDWSPAYTDSTRISGVFQGTSPCSWAPYKGYIFDNINLRVDANYYPIPGYGNAISMSFTNQLQSRLNQYWKIVVPKHALYLKRSIAKQYNATLWLVSKGGTTLLEFPLSSNSNTFIDRSGTRTLEQAIPLAGTQTSLDRVFSGSEGLWEYAAITWQLPNGNERIHVSRGAQSLQ